MGFLWSQLFVTPVYPKQSFDGQTVIVTGSNVGLGFEAAKHFARLNAKRVILAVRNMSAGEDAKKAIETETKRTGVCQVWKLDLSSYSSVKEFVQRATNELDRVDVLCENAGIAVDKFQMFEDNESTITVNVVSTFLLALLMLPKLEESAQKYGTTPRLTIVSSEVHAWTKFQERDAPSIFDTLSDEKTAKMGERYQTSKLLEVLAIRHIAPLLAQSKNKNVTLNMLNPGLCYSSLGRDQNSIALLILRKLLARTTEVGARTLVAAGTAGAESHGKYMSDAHVSEEDLAPWVKTKEGARVGEKVWSELGAKLERISPGILKNLQ